MIPKTVKKDNNDKASFSRRSSRKKFSENFAIRLYFELNLKKIRTWIGSIFLASGFKFPQILDRFQDQAEP